MPLLVQTNTPELAYQTNGHNSQEEEVTFSYCNLPLVSPRVFDESVDPDRAEIIGKLDKIWVNGTILHYYFFDKPTDGQMVTFSDGTQEWRTWVGSDGEKKVVSQAFKQWSDLGIGLVFHEVDSRDEGEIRIGFMRGNGSWSYVGRDNIDLHLGRDQRTMNFGWDLTRTPGEIDTALHEIGHAMGFSHEHQNPKAGIIWDEEAVYAALAKPPNQWDRAKTFSNIIQQLSPDTVQGSSWDPDSVMHYPFGPGLIKEPAQYRNGVHPAGGLSARDITWVKTFYPSQTKEKLIKLEAFDAVKLALAIGEQRNFTISPDATRYYEIRTFGISDAVLVLFEDTKNGPRYITGDDDSGENRNTHMKVKLFAGRKYILRVRLYYADRADETTIMIW